MSADKSAPGPPHHLLALLTPVALLPQLPHHDDAFQVLPLHFVRVSLRVADSMSQHTTLSSIPSALSAASYFVGARQLLAAAAARAMVTATRCLRPVLSFLDPLSVVAHMTEAARCWRTRVAESQTLGSPSTEMPTSVAASDEAADMWRLQLDETKDWGPLCQYHSHDEGYACSIAPVSEAGHRGDAQGKGHRGGDGRDAR